MRETGSALARGALDVRAVELGAGDSALAEGAAAAPPGTVVWMKQQRRP